MTLTICAISIRNLRENQCRPRYFKLVPSARLHRSVAETVTTFSPASLTCRRPFNFRDSTAFGRCDVAAPDLLSYLLEPHWKLPPEYPTRFTNRNHSALFVLVPRLSTWTLVHHVFHNTRGPFFLPTLLLFGSMACVRLCFVYPLPKCLVKEKPHVDFSSLQKYSTQNTKTKNKFFSKQKKKEFVYYLFYLKTFLTWHVDWKIIFF